MDRYLFRGKRVDNGEWIEGSLVEDYGRNYFITQPLLKTHRLIKVIPETIGQCTGLKDKNGKFIFEGDELRDVKGRGATVIVRFGTFTRKIVNCLNGKLQDMSITGFYLEYNGIPCLPFFENGKSLLCTYEIIGNIHDKVPS